MPKIKYTLVRNLESGVLTETFLVTSVASIVAIRVFLKLTGFPQLGVEGLHIAHMLWGGLIMLMVLGSVLIFMNPGIKKFAAVFGGIGFGVFIDEAGKLVTSTNNYFFEPTFSLIYIVLVAFYIVSRKVEKRKEPTEEEYLINALDFLKGAIANGISKADKKKVIQYLSKSDSQNKLTKDIKAIFDDIEVDRSRKPNRFTRVSMYFSSLYTRAIRWKWFGGLTIIIFLLSALLNAFIQLRFIVEAVILPLSSASFGSIGAKLDTTQAISLLIDAVVAAFVVLGALKIRTSKLGAYQLFKKAILIDILVGQIFLFYTDQLLALAGLIAKIALLEALNYMISQEIWKKENNKN